MRTDATMMKFEGRLVTGNDVADAGVWAGGKFSSEQLHNAVVSGLQQYQLND